MRKLVMAGFVAILAFGLSVGESEAARLGGSKSFGMQRQSVAPKPAAPAQQATSAAPAAPAAAPTVAPKRNWMGPIAGLAAGLGLAALLSHFGMGAGMANILMLALLATAAVFVFKLLFRRNSPTAQAAVPMQYTGVGGPSMSLPSQPVPQFGSVSATQRIPEGFDADAFLRVAKLNFVRLQASNDARNLDDIREFVSPEVFAEIKLQMDERGDTPQQTDIVTLNATLLEVATESERHIASVRFSGMVREVAHMAATPLDEIWHLSKAVEGHKGWVISGIQQL